MAVLRNRHVFPVEIDPMLLQSVCAAHTRRRLISALSSLEPLWVEPMSDITRDNVATKLAQSVGAAWPALMAAYPDLHLEREVGAGCAWDAKGADGLRSLEGI